MRCASACVAQGMRECERMINQRMQLACYLREQVKKRDGFQLVVEVSGGGSHC